MEPAEYAGRIGQPVRALGGAFMLDGATIARAGELDLDFAAFYGLGRTGVLGDTDPDERAAVDAGLTTDDASGGEYTTT